MFAYRNCTEYRWYHLTKSISCVLKDLIYLTSVYSARPRHSFTDVDYCDHVKAGRKTVGNADHRKVKYLPSSDISELSKRLVHLHLSIRLHHHHHQQQQPEVQAVVKANWQTNGKWQISTPEAPRPLNEFRWNLEYITKSSVWPLTQIHLALQQREWSRVWANTWPVTCWFLIRTVAFLLYSSDSVQPTQVVRFWRSIRHMTCFRTRKCLLGVALIWHLILVKNFNNDSVWH